ncbi:EAL domain-containing response regulator [Paludibacterium yongneupense]|uniref:EAL domain-containing response regulator n=1 Tax=Paludibacterium yongneupense TaxID=400061 RepID=UPI000422FE36|nr:EAL domain-containing response regulator [Paludibacterium yongneupense]
MIRLKIEEVLIIEDSAAQAALAADLCRALGVKRVRFARNGQDGLEQLCQSLPDLILLDLEMPVMDGVQVLQEMANDTLHVPLVLVSGKDSQLIASVEMLGRELGLPLLGGLQKPIIASALLDLLLRVWTPVDVSFPPPCESDAVRRALDLGQIRPYFQPKVDLLTGVPTGAEVLARWEDPQSGLIVPSRFVPVIEAHGWATELTLSMLDQCLAVWPRWMADGMMLPLSINMSASSLLGAKLATEIERRLRDAGVPPRLVIFELTETALVEHLADAIGIAARLRLAGCGLSIDDFGTGFATMQQLTRFPFTELKIDRSLVTEVHRRPHIEQILHCIVEMAGRLNLQTVAEGVETDEERTCLLRNGCTQAQGFLFARPMTAEAFVSWMSARRPAPTARTAPRPAAPAADDLAQVAVPHEVVPGRTVVDDKRRAGL